MSSQDTEMIQDFLEESRELLASMEEGFLELEKKGAGAEQEIIHSLFRWVHTIKGSSSFLGFRKIGRLSHLMETLMSRMREGSILPEKKYTDALLTGTDFLSRMISDIDSSESADIEEICGRLTALTEGSEIIPPPEPAAAADRSLLDGFVFEARKYMENLDTIFSALPMLRGEELQQNLILAIRAASAIRGTGSFTGFSNIPALAEGIEKAVTAIRNTPSYTPDENHAAVLLSAKDRLASLIDDIDVCDSVSVSAELADLSALTESLSRKKPETKPVTTSPVPVKTEEPRAAAQSESIRISLDLLDRLMRLAGELVLIRNQQLRLAADTEGVHREVVQRLDSVTTEIQETVMQTRLQPVGNIFSKLPRIVREAAKELGKDIEISLHGSEVELDKSILETLGAPLTHIIRNSCDHGIEMPGERKSAGKSASGNIHVSAFHESGLIHIQIRDDGKGLDPEYIADKALAKGLRTQTELNAMSPNEIINLIMLPGFSTRDSVSSLSGRGVGMDVVKTAVERMNGSVEIQSSPGQGTLITLRLPLTLAIIPSLIVVSGGLKYAIPQVNLDELVSVDPTAGERGIESAGGQEVFRLRDNLLPIVRLSEVLTRPLVFTPADKKEIIKKYQIKTAGHTAVSGAEKESYLLRRRREESIHFAVVSAGNRRFGLVIDAVEGTEEIVVKPVHPALRRLRIYSGATILGDGKVSLILDAEGIAAHAACDFSTEGSWQSQESAVHSHAESILIFHSGKEERFAISLHMISHIKEVERKSIEKIGSREMITLDGTSYRIIKLDEVMPVSPFEYRDSMFLLLLKYVKEPIGILISSLVDIVETDIELKNPGFIQEGILGTAQVMGKMTLFVDVHQILEKTEPSVFGQRQHIEQIVKGHNRSQPDFSGKKVLLVEDSSIFRQMLSRYLKAEGFEVTTAEDGTAGLQCLEEHDFDLIVSDLEMPNLNGFDFMKQVRSRKHLSGIPSLALSSLNDDFSVRKAKECGFTDYEIKLEKDHFLEKVHSLMQVVENV